MTKRKPWWRIKWGQLRHWWATVTNPEPWEDFYE